MAKSKVAPDDVDPEALAYSKVVSALAKLDVASQKRVLQFAANRFNVSLADHPPKKGSTPDNGGDRETDAPQFLNFTALFEAASPQGMPNRVITAAYWFQMCQGKESFSGQDINDTLKDLGHASPNITVEMNRLKAKKPALIQQIAKAGKTKQARKKYKLTQAGIRAVKNLLSGKGSDEG